MSFFSALYMLWNVLIVIISCKIVYSKKKNDPYFGMGKNGDFELCAQQIWIKLSWNKWVVGNLTE